MKVIFLTPHPMRFLASWHPSVPAPKSRHLVDCISSILRLLKSLHFISLMFKSTASLASVFSSMKDFKSICCIPFLCLIRFSNLSISMCLASITKNYDVFNVYTFANLWTRYYFTNSNFRFYSFFSAFLINSLERSQAKKASAVEVW